MRRGGVERVTGVAPSAHLLAKPGRLDPDAMGWRVYRPVRRGRISSARADGTRMKLSSIESLVRALNDARVRFIVVGGLAVVAHGYGRQTQDVDLVIRLRPDSIGAAFAALSSLGYRPRVPVTAEMLSDRATRDALVRDRGMVVLAFHSESHAETPVDVFAAEPFDFETEYDAAKIVDLAPGVPVRIVRLATLLDMKRSADRPQDRADVAELTAIHGGLGA